MPAWSAEPVLPVLDLSRARRNHVGMGHAGWAYDAYPELGTLDAGTTMTVLDVEGPGVVTRIHVTRHLVDQLTRRSNPLPAEELRALGARGVVLEILYDNAAEPAVQVPLADFFADGCGARGMLFTTPFVEKAPGSYNCSIPMPFREHIRVRLRNDTGLDLLNYTVVEFVKLDQWDEGLLHLHAAWSRSAFQLDPETDEQLVRLEGPGHLVGQSWSIATDDPFFRSFAYLMEGNNEFRIDGEEEPSLNYLGTEDAFGFAFGFQEPFAGTYSGIPFVQERDPALLSVYRFRAADAIPFRQSLDLRVNWRNEFRSPLFEERIVPLNKGRDWLPPDRSEGGGWVDYATTFYWYAEAIEDGTPRLPELTDRVAPVLRPNP
jgi:hypothetical protein